MREDLEQFRTKEVERGLLLLIDILWQLLLHVPPDFQMQCLPLFSILKAMGNPRVNVWILDIEESLCKTIVLLINTILSRKKRDFRHQ